jgi:hypothetical protein
VNVAVGARVGVFVEVAEGVAEGVAVGVDVAVIGGRLASASTVLITAVSNKSASLRVGTAQAARTSKPPVDIKCCPIQRVLTVKFGIGILARTVRRLGVPLI